MIDGRDRSQTERRGVQVAIMAYTLWGLLTVYWKQLSDFDAVEVIGWRMVSAAVVMCAVTTVRGTWTAIWSALGTRATAMRLIAAAVLIAGNWGSYVWAVTHDRVIETALGYFIAPLATMAIGVVVLGEQPNRAQRVAFASASIAVVILTISAGRPPWIALAIAGTFCLYGLTKRQIPLGAIDSLTGETLVLLVPAVVLLAVLSSRPGSAYHTASPTDWALLLGSGLITAIPLLLFSAAAKTVPFTLLGPLNLLVPVINFALGWLVYDEPVPLDRAIGFGFVWFALLVVMNDRLRRSRQR